MNWDVSYTSGQKLWHNMNNGNTMLGLQLCMINLDDNDNRPCVIQYDWAGYETVIGIYM